MIGNGERRWLEELFAYLNIHHRGITFLVNLQQQGDITAIAYIEHLFPSVETRWKERVNEHRNLSTPVKLEAFVETRELCVGLCQI